MVEKIYYCSECGAPNEKVTKTPIGNKYEHIECDCEYEYRVLNGGCICDKCGVNEALKEQHKTGCGNNDTF